MSEQSIKRQRSLEVEHLEQCRMFFPELVRVVISDSIETVIDVAQVHMIVNDFLYDIFIALSA